MAFLSELLNKPVTNLDGEHLGRLCEISAHYPKEFSHPVVSSITLHRERDEYRIPISHIIALTPRAIVLNAPLEQIEAYQPSEHDILLTRDVLDKQIIDIDGVRVVRVNDLELLRVNDQIVASNVDIGAMGIIRRIGLEKIADPVFHKLKWRIFHNYVSWDNVEILWHDDLVRLNVSRDKIADLHPADIVDILSDMSQSDSRKFAETLDVPQLADMLEEIETDFQLSLLKELPSEKIADLLEEMAPDAAADLLAEMPQEQSEELLGLMDADDAEDVRELLQYPEDSAGGLMTTEYISIPMSLTAAQAIDYLRMNAAEAETIFYVYITDAEEHLVGIISLSDLILANPQASIIDFMHKRIVSANLRDNQNHIAKLVAKYNLLAIPIVDDENRLQGIVTSDDALDQIIPTAWKKRMPRLHKH